MYWPRNLVKLKIVCKKNDHTHELRTQLQYLSKIIEILFFNNNMEQYLH